MNRMIHSKKLLFRNFVFLLLSFFISQNIFAVPRTWIGSGSGAGTSDFNLGTNWSPNGVPRAEDDLTINLIANINATINLTANISVNSLSIIGSINDVGSGNTGRSLLFSVGNFTLSTASNVVFDNSASGQNGNRTYDIFIVVNSTGIFNIGGIFSLANKSTSPAINTIRVNNSGTIVVAGSTTTSSLNTGASSFVGLNVGDAPAKYTFNGNVNFDDGSTVVNNYVLVGSTTPGTTGSYIFKGDLSLGNRATTDSTTFNSTTVVFDAINTQTITYNNSIRYFYIPNLIVGETNNPTVLLAGATVPDNVLRNITINGSSILDLNSRQLNRNSNGGTFLLRNTSQLKLGASSSVSAAGTATLTGGSNFPSGFTTITLDSTSTVEFNGAIQSIPGFTDSVKSYGNLTLSNGSTKTLRGKISIFRNLSLVGNTTMALDNFDATLKSNSVTTAYVSAVPTTAAFTYGSGRFEVERHLFSQKSWRFLSVPLLKLAQDPTSPTINSSWRENGTTLAATLFGTRITGPGTIGFSAGVDENTQRGSMKFYEMAANNYREITSADLAANRTIANDEGYYVFVRGDRGVNVPSGATGATTLRAKGKLRTGPQTYSVNANSFQSVGNPYASRIRFSSVTKTANIENSFVAWNPANTGGGYGVGRFQQYALFGSDYFSSIYGVKNFIESGEAFFITAAPTGSGTITINENDKGSGSSLFSRAGVTSPTLEINLLTKGTDNTFFKVDAAVVNFDNGWSNSIDNNDVKKFLNVTDNLSILKNNIKLFAERRTAMQPNDSIVLSILNTRLGNYKLEIDPSVLNGFPLKAYIKDKFLKAETAVSLSDTTNINFEITTDPASRLEDRFAIVFKANSPVRFTAITAVRHTDKSANITWNTENENNVNSYKIERSDDGINYTAIGTQTPTANNFGNPYYAFNDASASAKINYYRIIADNVTASAFYSNVAVIKALKESTEKEINIYPNPITNGNVNLNFGNANLGNYIISIRNIKGQLILSKSFKHMTASETLKIEIPTATQGLYNATIVDADGIKNIIPFMIGE